MSKRLIQGIDDLPSKNPNLAAEWDYERNTLQPTEVFANSHLYAYWICRQCGHKWSAQIKSRNRGNGCPVCGKKKAAKAKATATPGASLAEVRPDLLEEWAFEKNVGIDPFKTNPGSQKKVFWKCHNGHIWPAKIINRTRRNQGCPYCYGATKTSFPEQALFYYIAQSYVAKNRAQMGGYEFDILLPENNIAIEYDGAFWHSSNRALKMEQRKNEYCAQNGFTLFRLKETNERNASVYSEGNTVTYLYDSWYSYLDKAIQIVLDKIETITGKPTIKQIHINDDRGAILSNYQQVEYETSIASMPVLLREWDSEKNSGIRPENILLGSVKQLYWICPKGHSYKARVSHRVSGSGCPICANKIIVPGLNDLASQNAELTTEWNDEKNGDLKPTQVSPSSSKPVWWKCPVCGHEWEATVNSRNSGRGCPNCGRLRQAESSRRDAQDWVTEFLAKKSPNVQLLGNYIKNTERIKCRCTLCGNEWMALPDNLLRGSGCPKCARNHKKSKDEFISELHDKNPFIGLVGEFTNCTTATTFKCLSCGYEWSIAPSRLLFGNGCPKCRKKAAAERIEKPVLQYDKNGHFLKKYRSAGEAAKELGVRSKQTINSACQHTKKSAYGYIWRYENDNVPIEQTVSINRSIQYSNGTSNRPQKVLQIKDGRVIHVFNSANEAGRAMGCVNGANIVACCKGKHKSAYGYQWRYDNDAVIQDLRIEENKVTG